MRKLYPVGAACGAILLIGWVVSKLPSARVRHVQQSQPASTPRGLRFRDGWELRWGQTRGQIAEHLGAAVDCRDIARNSMGLAQCRISSEVLQTPFVAGEAWFMRGRFFRLSLTFPPDDYARVARDVSQGFAGPGATLTGETMLNTGARGPQLETHWSGGEVTAVMRLHDGENRLGSLSITYEPIADAPPDAGVG